MNTYEIHISTIIDKPDKLVRYFIERMNRNFGITRGSFQKVGRKLFIYQIYTNPLIISSMVRWIKRRFPVEVEEVSVRRRNSSRIPAIFNFG
jgi:hypothetical protein